MPTPVRSATIRRNAVFALAAEASRAVLSAALVLAVTRILGPDEYGVYALAATIGALTLLPADFGVSASAARFLAERRDDRAAAAAVLHDSLRLKLVLAGTVSVAVFAAAGPVADAYDEPGLLWPLRATALTLLAQSVFALCIGAFVALGRASLQATLYLVEGVVEVTLVVSAAALTGSAAYAALGRGAAFALALVVAMVLVVRLVTRRALPTPSRRSDVGLFGYARYLFVVDAAFSLLTTLDVLLIGAFLSSEDVGLFEAPLRVLMFVLILGTAVSSAVAPRLARTTTGEPNVLALAQGLRGLVVVGGLASAFAFAWAEPIVHVALGDEYARSADVLRAFAPFLTPLLLAPLATLGVNYVGLAPRRVPLVLGALGINAVLNAILIPSIGIVGGAIASGVAYLIYVPGHLLLLRGAVALPLRALLATAARVALAGAVATAALLAFQASGLTVLSGALGAAVGTLVFVAGLLALREVAPRELRHAAAIVRGARPRS